MGLDDAYQTVMWIFVACGVRHAARIGLLILLLTGAARAHPNLDVTGREPHFDEMITAELRGGDIAGAAVVVVQSGRVVLAKGYGFADVAKRKPVVADATLFRLGSVSKLFTWQAVMQLVEAGKIDLDRDVSAYLDFPVQGLHGEPVTMRHLMTHTAGFEERFQGLWVADGRQVAQLRDYLVRYMPARIYAAGRIPAYSNYGATLAGYVVERVSGESFADYVERHITGPLGMRRTTARQPLPPELAPWVAQGYVRASAEAHAFEYIRAPAGGMSASAADMGRFMLAQLNGGALGDARILSESMTARMLAPQPVWPAATNSLGLGWLNLVEHEPWSVGHDGATLYFQSILNLYPRHDAGLFVVLNSRGRMGEHSLGRIVQQFEHWLLPLQEVKAAPLSIASPCPDGVAGAYLPSRRSDTGLGYAMALAMQIRLHCRAGVLTVSEVGARGEDWQPVALHTWQSAGGERLHLKPGQNGAWALSMGNPVSPYLQGHGFQDARMIAVLGGCTVLALALTALRGAWLMLSARSLRAIPLSAAISSAALILCMTASAMAAMLPFHAELALSPWFDVALATLQIAGWLGVAILLWQLKGLRSWDRWDWLGWGGAAGMVVLALDLNLLAFGPRY